MSEQKPYQSYLDLGQERYKVVEQVKHQQPTSVDWIKFSYPEEDFIQLFGQMDKKPIKIKTYRQKVDPNKFNQPKGVIVFFHNLGMTGLVSGHLAEDLAKEGYQTVAMDYRGHGKSQGEKGTIDSAQNVLKDANNFIVKVADFYSKKIPMFFLGDGLGCLILLNMVKQKMKLPFKAIVFAGPSFGKPKRSKILSAVSDFSLKLLPGSTGIFAFLFQNNSRNPNAGKLMQQSQYFYHEKVKVRTLEQLLKMSQKMDEKKTYQNMQLPDILVIQGQNDRSSDAFNTISFYQSITSNKQMWYFQKMWHMFLVEKEYFEIRDRLVKWLNQRV